MEAGQAVRATETIIGTEFQVLPGTLGFVLAFQRGGWLFGNDKYVVRFIGKTGIVQVDDVLSRSLDMVDDSLEMPTDFYELLVRPRT